MKCELCQQEYSPQCDYRQGRCPHHPSMLTDYHYRYLNLFNTIKKWFQR